MRVHTMFALVRELERLGVELRRTRSAMRGKDGEIERHLNELASGLDRVSLLTRAMAELLVEKSLVPRRELDRRLAELAQGDEGQGDEAPGDEAGADAPEPERDA